MKVTAFIFLICFQLSFMQDMSPYIYIVPFFPLLIFFMWLEGVKFSISFSFTMLSISSFFILSILLYDHLYPIVYPEVLNLVVAIFLFYISFNYFKGRTKQLLDIVNIVLAFNVCFFFLQIALYLTTNIYLDPLQFVTDIPARYEFSSGGWDLVRATGLTHEPGSYATHIIPFLFGSYILTKRLTPLHVLTLISMLATFSVFSLVYILLFVFVLLREKLFKNPVFVCLFLLVMFFIFYFLFYDYIVFRFFSDNSDGSLRIKLYALTFLMDAPLPRVLLGSGFAYNDCNCLIADNTMYFSMFYTFGLFSLIPICYFILKFKSDLDSLLLMFSLMMSKLLVFYPLFWIFVMILYVVKFNGKRCNV